MWDSFFLYTFISYSRKLLAIPERYIVTLANLGKKKLRSYILSFKFLGKYALREIIDKNKSVKTICSIPEMIHSFQ